MIGRSRAAPALAAITLVAACDEVITTKATRPPLRFEIHAGGDGFTPGDIEIFLGDTVWFRFSEPAHSVVWDPQGYSTLPLPIASAANTIRVLVIGRTGRFAYRCALHDDETGVINVLPLLR
jgi:plastocyanin